MRDQLKAIKAFDAMMPAFHHARCVNCHGGVDPFSDKHRGVDQVENNGDIEQCQQCHDGLPGWMVPGDPLFFVGKSDEQLCLQVKQFEKTGPDFVEHIRIDHGETQFIAAAFKGDRALGEALKDYDLVIDQPPGTQAELTEKARKWVAALNGVWKDPPECGCVKPKLELKMTSEWVGTGNGNSITHQVSATVLLEPDTSGLIYSGEAPLQHDKYTMTRLPSCRITPHPSGGKLQVNELRLDIGEDQRMSISLAVQRQALMDGGNVGIACSHPLPISSLPLIGWTGEWQFLHDEQDRIGQEYRFDEFESASGLALAGDRKLIGHKEVKRSKTYPKDVTMKAKTTFELWWVGAKTSP